MKFVVAVVLDDYLQVPLYTHNGRENRRNGVQEGISEFLWWTREGANTFASTARGGFTIFMLGNTAQESHRRAEAAFSLQMHRLTMLLTVNQREDDAMLVI